MFDETNNELLRESSQPEINSEEAETRLTLIMRKWKLQLHAYA